MRTQRGMTLLELIVTITVLGVAGLALVGTLGYIAGTSGDSLAETQAQSVADSYLANTLAQPFASVASSNTTYASMQVSIAVSSSGALPGVPASDARRVDVTVTTDSGQSAVATGYRLLYP